MFSSSKKCFLVPTVILIILLAQNNRTNPVPNKSIYSYNNNEHHRRLTQDSWTDPKSVVAKMITTRNVVDWNSLRFVAFGTSRTWGVALENPDQESYIKLLSPTGLNLGLRATLSDYPSLCLYSMIGERVFDVIIVEFPPYTGKHHDDFARLVSRLRNRFPNAILIYLHATMPVNEFHYQKRLLKDYLRSSKGITSLRNPAFAKAVQSLNTSQLEYHHTAFARDKYYNVMQSVGGHVVEFPILDLDYKRYIIDNTIYFGSDQRPWDTTHPSKLGHERIADKIRQLLLEVFDKRNQQQQQQPIAAAAGTAVQPWSGGHDQCLSWFSTGNLTNEVVRDINNMVLVEFDRSQQKWALEVYRTGGSFSVVCPFPKCSVYLSFMVIGPQKEYPRVWVSLNQQEPILIDPYDNSLHVRRIAHVGTVDMPGLVTVNVRPLPEAPLHFRITGVIATPGKVK